MKTLSVNEHKTSSSISADKLTGSQQIRLPCVMLDVSFVGFCFNHDTHSDSPLIAFDTIVEHFICLIQSLKVQTLTQILFVDTVQSDCLTPPLI